MLYFTTRVLKHQNDVLLDDVRTNCFCARNSHATSCFQRARWVVKWTIIGQMALRGFNDLGRSVTPIFLYTSHFLNRFSTLSKKVKKIYQVEVWIFCQTSIEFRSFDSIWRTALRYLVIRTEMIISIELQYLPVPHWNCLQRNKYDRPCFTTFPNFEEINFVYTTY